LTTNSRKEKEYKNLEIKLDLIKRRLNILMTLYREGSLNETILASKTDLDRGNLSHYKKELEDAKLVWVRKEKADGNDRRYIALTDQSLVILNALLKDEKSPLGLQPLPSDEDLDYAMEMLSEADVESREDGSGELVRLSREYIIPPQSIFFNKIALRLTSEVNPTVVVNLLEALRTTMLNSPGTLQVIREKYLTTLSDIAEEKHGDALDDRATGLALRILSIAYEGKDRFTHLSMIYEKLLEEESTMARTALGLIIENDADKVRELRKLLYRRLKSTPKVSTGQREMIRDHLTQL
jgi:DNA-binding MarR family transcriptional regulator